MKHLLRVYISLVVDFVLCRILKIDDLWTKIDDVLFVGGLPLPQDRELFKAHGIRGVINLCSEFKGPMHLYRQEGIAYHWIPTQDFSSPSIDDTVKAIEVIEGFSQRGETVLVHCKAGKERSISVALCWLMKSQRIEPSTAQKIVEELRPQIKKDLFKRPLFSQYYQLYRQ